MMTTRRALLGFLFASVLVPLAWADVMARWYSGPPPPLHPTIIEGDYKGKMLPIVSVSTETPKVEVEGKLKTVSTSKNHGYRPRRGASYAPGSIQLRSVNAHSSRTDLVLMFDHGGEVSGGTLMARSDFSATVIPTRDYTECYIALIFFDQNYLEGGTDDPHASVQFGSIKNLAAGKENKINLAFNYMDFNGRRVGYFPLFFTHGMEIRSDQCELIAQFFHRREMIVHEAYLKAYCEKNRDQSLRLEAYLKIPPIFPEDMSFEGAPKSVMASFMVSEEGRLESLRFEENLPNDIASTLSRTLYGWLFLPRLKDGRPVRTMVTIPLHLAAPEAKAPAPAQS